MESYTASFVTPGLLAEELEPVAISWVGGRRSRDVELSGLQEPAWVRAACSSPTWGDRENASFCRELGNTLWDVLL